MSILNDYDEPRYRDLPGGDPFLPPGVIQRTLDAAAGDFAGYTSLQQHAGRNRLMLDLWGDPCPCGLDESRPADACALCGRRNAMETCPTCGQPLCDGCREAAEGQTP